MLQCHCNQLLSDLSNLGKLIEVENVTQTQWGRRGERMRRDGDERGAVKRKRCGKQDL